MQYILIYILGILLLYLIVCLYWNSRHNLYYEYDTLHQKLIHIKNSVTLDVFIYHCLIMVP
jgi:uncharacterized paraquat-inducible protein A